MAPTPDELELERRISEAERDANASMMQVRLTRDHLTRFSTYSMMEGEADEGGGAVAPLPEKLPASTFLAFVVLGAGPSWLLCDALFLQVPYLEQIQPEGPGLAAVMTFSFNVGSSVFIIVFLIAHRLWRGQRTALDEMLILGMTCLTIVSLLALAFLWPIHVGGYSVALLGFGVVGGAIGGLRNTVQMPWLLRYDSRLVSASITGSAAADAVAAVIALIQRPADDTRAFGPSVYYVILAVLTTPSLVAFFLIKRYRLGEMPTVDTLETGHAMGLSARAALQNLSAVREHSSGCVTSDANLRPAASADSRLGADGGASPAGADVSPAATATKRSTDSAVDALTIDARPGGAAATGPCGGCAPHTWPVWWPRAARLFFLYGVIQLFVWGVVPGLLPFAALRVADAAGPNELSSHEVLQYAVELSYLGLIAGAWLSLPVPWFATGRQSAMLVLLGLVSVVLAFDMSSVLAQHVPSWVLVASVVGMRALDGYTSSMIFRSVSVDERYGDSQYHVQRAITLAERIMTPLGALAVVALVKAVLEPGLSAGPEATST